MIRRTRLHYREEHKERRESQRDEYQKGKQSIGKVSRFHYAIQGLPREESCEQPLGRTRRYQESRTPCNQNESSFNIQPLLHPSARLLKKDYLYADRNIDQQEHPPVLTNRQINTSLDLNRSGFAIPQREGPKACNYQSIANHPKGLSVANDLISNGYDRRRALFAQSSIQYLDDSAQFLKRSSKTMEKRKTEEELEATYEQIYANNQRQKLKNSNFHQFPPAATRQPNKENVIINTKQPIKRITANREHSQSIAKYLLTSDNIVQTYNQSSSKKVPISKGIQTRKTSPNKIKQYRTSQFSQLATLRTSPQRNNTKIVESDNTEKLINQFVTRVTWKIEELELTVKSLRSLK